MDSGIATLIATPGGPFVTGRTTAITVTATAKDGVPEVGPVTLQPTSPGVTIPEYPTSCRQNGTGGLVCADSTITGLALALSADETPGPLPLRVTDAGGRIVTLADADGVAKQIVRPGPAVVALSNANVAAAADRRGHPHRSSPPP